MSSWDEDPEPSVTPSKRPKYHHHTSDTLDTCYYIGDWNFSLENAFYEPIPSLASGDDDSNEFGQSNIVSPKYNTSSILHVEQTFEQITQNGTEQEWWGAILSENSTDVVMLDASGVDEAARDTSQSTVDLPDQEDICFGMV
jgi:hypothetical protein